jgi:hypothetical protein
VKNQVEKPVQENRAVPIPFGQSPCRHDGTAIPKVKYAILQFAMIAGGEDL